MFKEKMLNRIISLYILLCLFSCSSFKHNNKKAKLFFKEQLSIIHNSYQKKERFKIKTVENAITHLEKITGIISQSDMNIYGRFSPTKEDMDKWTQWFEENKSKIYWDSKEGKIRLKE
jgi:hypothetical protein